MANVFYSWEDVVEPALVNNKQLAGDQSAAITALRDGSGYLAAWNQPGGMSVSGRLFNASGTPVGDEFQINSTVNNQQYDPSLAVLSNGNVVVTFTDHSTDIYGDMRARLFKPDGSAVDLDFGVNTTANDDMDSDVAALADGGFVVTWTQDYSGDKDILAKVFNSDGTPRSGLLIVDSSAALDTNSSQVVGLADGNFVVVWEQASAGGGSTAVYQQIYDSNGIALTSAQPIDTFGTINKDIQIVALQDGGYAVAYTDNGWGNGTDISVQMFNADGTSRSSTLIANSALNFGTVAGDQMHPTLTVMSNGYVLVGWNNGQDLVYQAYDPNGNAIGSNFTAGTGVIEAEVAGLAGGLVADVYSSTANSNSIQTSTHALVRTTWGDGPDEALTGDSLRDRMFGWTGNDTLSGGGGDDELIGGAGDDRLDGGSGIDLASYRTNSSGVKVDLAIVGAQNTGGAGIDTLISIEEIFGTYFNDVLSGNAQHNKIFGGDGDDVIEGRGGNDTMYGGMGSDWASYASAGSAVKVNLAISGAQNTGGAGTDTLFGFENLIGSAFKDVLTGDAQSNQLKGGAGADVLRGAAGDDSLDGGAGSDILDGGAGSDWASYASAASGVKVSLALAGAQNTVGAGIDTLTSIEHLSGSTFNDTLTGNGAGNYLKGGAGADTLNGAGGSDTLEGGSGSDILNGGAGSDWASYASAGSAVTVNLALAGAQNTAGAGVDKLISIESLIGSNFHDTLTGSAGSNTILGGAGNDIVKGGGGDDVLIGQHGADELTGGAGNDIFVFQSRTDSTLSLHDLITDFSPGDRIDLSAIDADTGIIGNQAFHLDGTVGGTGDIGLSFDAVNNRTVINLYVNNDATVDATIWLSGNHTNLTAADFVL